MAVFQHISVTVFMVAILAGCSSLPDEVVHHPEPQVSQPASTLSTLSHTYQQAQISQSTSAVMLQDTGWDALAQRVALIETAEHSIDIQYYIWNSDVSGTYLASRLLKAADRGVQVRVMLDDINLNAREDLFTTLNSHPQVEIRIFNPTPSRSGFSKWFSFLGDFSRLNRRMHNKSFTVDGALSVVGGRNIGDEYFDLSDDINFRDRDVLVMGPVVGEISASFGEYWNSRWSYPVTLLGGEGAPELPEISEISTPIYKNYPALPEGNQTAHQFLNGLVENMAWVNARYVFDRPVPIDSDNTDEPKATALELAELARQSEQEIILESAYLIFDDAQLEELQKLTSNDIVIKALTNSMVSNDLVTNHSGYAGRRQDMLEHGIQLFELKPDSSLCEESTKDVSKCAPTAAYGLHTKSVVFDEKVAGIGSFNFNLRSIYLNTESLLVIEDERIAKELAEDMAKTMNEEHSWRLAVNDGDVSWHSGSKEWDSEPETGQWERFQSWFLQLLPIEKYL